MDHGMTEQATRQAIDAPWPLPAGWCWVQVGDVVKLRGAKISPDSAPDLPFVGMDDIEANGLQIKSTRPFSGMKSAGNYFKVGDILYGRLRPYLNKTAIANEDGAASGELLPLVPGDNVNVCYLQLLIHAKYFVNRAMSSISGDRPRIDFDTISQFPFPLAPLPEQKRIVARIDALFAEIAAGEAALEEARTGLETFRRALLKAAVSGDLTAGWRADRARAGKPVGETGADLLARIRAERANAAPRKTRGRRQPTAPADLSALPDLPEGWAWATLGEVVQDSLIGLDRGASNQRSVPPGAPYIKMQNVTRTGSVEFDHLVYVDASADELRKFSLMEGDVLFNTRNSKELVGKTGISKTPPAGAIFNNNLMRIRTLDKRLNQWLCTIMNAAPFLAQMEKIKKATTSVAAIYAGELFGLPIPLPPPEEMTEILSRVTAALEATAETRALLETEAADAARLRQSVLKAAFEGRLVPQDPADEPAAALLARTRSTAPPAPRRGRRKAP